MTSKKEKEKKKSLINVGGVKKKVGTFKTVVVFQKTNYNSKIIIIKIIRENLKKQIDARYVKRLN